MNEPSPPAQETGMQSLQAQILRMITGSWLTQMIYVATQLNIPELIQDQPRSVEELATATGAHAPSLYRLMRALTSGGLFTVHEGGRYGNSPLAALLRPQAPGSVYHTAMMLGEPAVWRAWGNLSHNIRTGESAFEYTHGQPAFEYLAAHPDEAAHFNIYMTQLSKTEDAAILKSYDFSSLQTVVDVGGGQGGLLAALLRTHGTLRGILFDLPQVVAGATHLQDPVLASRCDVIGGDFLSAVPAAGDTYILKRVLHDWDDDRAATILRHCRDSMNQGGKVLVMDAVIPTGNEAHLSKLLDVHMLVLSGGRERTEAEFRALFEMAGLELTRIIRTPSMLCIVEGVWK